MKLEGNNRRSPVIVVLGHVDHGKTTLLDAIRKTSVAAREAGGITQSIGAYEIWHPSTGSGQVARKFTFIDTPGHEAFTKMRSRGTNVADIAILVVAADDGVQPQTKEAIGIIREAKIPFVVAINKMDKQGIDDTNVKNQLTAEGVLLEGYGGSVSFQPISAKTGQGVNELLDLIALSADVADLHYDPSAAGEGVILEAKRDSRRGIIATGIIKNGTMHQGDELATQSVSGKAKGLENFMGTRIKEATASSPVLIFGFEALPEIGEPFATGAKAAALTAVRVPAARPGLARAASARENERLVLVMLKGDVGGSLEALHQIVENLPRPENVTLRIAEESVGDISDGDVQHAISTGAMIVGFRAAPTRSAQMMARVHGVKILQSDIVYELAQALEREFKTMERTVVKGDLEILAVFGAKGGNQQIIGGKVVLGTISNHAMADVVRRESVIGSAKIINTQSGKQDVPAIEFNQEGGLFVECEASIRAGEHIIVR